MMDSKVTREVQPLQLVSKIKIEKSLLRLDWTMVTRNEIKEIKKKISENCKGNPLDSYVSFYRSTDSRVISKDRSLKDS